MSVGANVLCVCVFACHLSAFRPLSLKSHHNHYADHHNDADNNHVPNHNDKPNHQYNVRMVIC